MNTNSEVVTLTGHDKRNRQLIREHGRHWVVLAREPAVICFGGQPGVLVESVDESHSRWMRPEHLRDVTP